MATYHGVNTVKHKCLNSVLNVKVIVASFNQEKVIVQAFSVIVNLRFKLYHRRRLGYGDCFRSVFSLHNETVNIWTHLLGFLFFLVLMVKDLVWAQDHIRDTADYGATALQLLTYQVTLQQHNTSLAILLGN